MNRIYNHPYSRINQKKKEIVKQKEDESETN